MYRGAIWLGVNLSAKPRSAEIHDNISIICYFLDCYIYLVYNLVILLHILG